MGRAHALAGNTDRARELLQEIGAAHRVSAIEMAGLLAAVGDKDEALGTLERAFEEREGGIVWINVGAELDPLRADPRFRDLVRRLNLPT